MRQGKVVKAPFSLIVLVPAVTALIALLVETTGLMRPLLFDVVMAGINVAAFAALIRWSASRIKAAHAPLWEMACANQSAPIALTTPLGMIQHWSRGCEDLYGWSAADAMGRSKHELLHSQEVQSQRLLRRADATHHQQRELIERCRDGTTV